MQRIRVEPRPNLAERARETGFELVTIDGQIYWDERAYYGFSLSQIEDDIEAPTRELAAMCVELAGRVVADQRMLERLAIPPHAWELIADSWRRRDPTLYGRFDLAYDGTAPAKLLEYNADTPTALFEAAVFQWVWLEDALAGNLIPAGCDQFNSLHEKLIATLRQCGVGGSSTPVMHLACLPDSIEDRGLVAYLADCASQAGLMPKQLAMADIGSTGSGPFVDLENQPIELLFKLYPWEWMLADPFSRSPSMRATRFIEPPWKAIVSNKGILPLLWEMAPRHPNLLPAYFDDDAVEGGVGRARLGGSYARKPLYSREGSNVTLVVDGAVVDSDDGAYGREGYIVQALADVPRLDGQYPVIGSWVVGDAACGIGVREDASPITKNTSRFVPHAILP